MKKYLEVFRLSFKMQIVWRFDVAMTMATTAGKIIAAWILWRAIFEGRTAVSGFDFEAMLSYYIVSSIVSSIDFSHQISGEVSDLIRNGRFSGHMVIPMNPLVYFGSMSAGETAFHLFFSLAVAALCAFAFNINLMLTAHTAQILLAALLILTGLAFMACYHYLIGTLAFKFFEIGFFLIIQGNIIAFVTGSLIPLSLLPKPALFVLRLFPFSHVVYTPAMLLTGQGSAAEGLFGLAVLAAWTLLVCAASQAAYNHFRKKYDGVGI